ncbi:MAG: PHP domain-containing protein [Candidatus Diapherotrites archaeon]|nr:PHP domain-containing protein [Candidatus Diapherotrites archaeon]
MKFDLHVHSCYSRDAVNKPETLIRRAKELGINIAITDHNTTAAYPKLKKISKKSGVSVIPGMEMDIYSEGKYLGELSALFLQEAPKANEFPAIVDEIKKQDALLYAPHPFDVFRSGFRELGTVAKKLDALEAFNSRCYFSGFNRKAEAYADAHKICKIAGSDAHFPQEIGKAITEFNCDNLEGVRKAIKKRNTRIYGEKSSPIVHFYTFLRKRKLLKEA